MLDIPPRYMWGWSPPGPPTASGYCGSASVQSTALYFGNWITQMAVRDTSGGHDAAHSILLGRDEDLPTSGTSVMHACAELKLDCSAWDYDAQPTPQHASSASGSYMMKDCTWGQIEALAGSDERSTPPQKVR